MKIIALTGGIGSGKSVVSSILRTIGYHVYDCDSRAKHVMDNSQYIKERLVQAFGNQAVAHNGVIDRKYLSRTVFGNPAALKQLNEIVHPAVRHDIIQWAANIKADCAFVETAILKGSGLSEITNEEWNVQAPLEIRISRVMHRNNIPRQAVEARIKAQSAETPTNGATIIINDGITPLLPQIVKLCTAL